MREVVPYYYRLAVKDVLCMFMFDIVLLSPCIYFEPDEEALSGKVSDKDQSKFLKQIEQKKC